MIRNFKDSVLLQHDQDANFNFSASHQGDYVGIASEPPYLVGLDIVSVSKPQGEIVVSESKIISRNHAIL
jgi:phosphopantetheinyl transferase